MFITEVRLNCISIPPKNKALVCIHCKTIHESLLANLIALQYDPHACELIDHFILECTKNNIQQQKNRFFIKGDPGAILVVELAAKNDKDLLEGCGDGEAEEAVDVQYATEEAGKGGLDPESATMEFVDGDDDDAVEVLIDALMQDDAGLNDVDEIHGTEIMTPVS